MQTCKKILKSSVRAKSLKITTSFEGTGYTTVSGNFDGQGLSLGLLQWNFGQGTLQPLLMKMLTEHAEISKSILGDCYTKLMHALNLETQKICACTNLIPSQKDGQIIEPWKTALKLLCNTKEFQKIQDEACEPYIQKAIAMCNKFSLYTERAFCLFFDIAVQNGSVMNPPGFTAMDYDKKLCAIVASVVSRSNKRWQDDVRSRKECILNGKGTVHGKNYTLDITDNSAFDNDITEALAELHKNRVINSPDYWLQHAYDGNVCDASYCKKLIENYCNVILEHTITDYKLCVDVLHAHGEINSPDFWKGIIKPVDGAIVNLLITNMSKLINT